MINVITVDVEEWYHSNGLNIPEERWGDYPSTVVANTRKILDLFDCYGVKATFFVLGCVAKAHPYLIREIAERGHEIGSHGYNHRLVSQLSIKEFASDFVLSLDILEDVIGKKILNYRAPSWSISKERLEVLFILESYGITCDSSLQPFQTPLSGINGLPCEPFFPLLKGRALNLVEFPPTVYDLSNHIKVPYAGGFYLRFLPYWFIHCCLNNLNRKRAGMVYIHPWELDTKIPRMTTAMHIKFIQYYGLAHTFTKLEKLLKNFQFANMGEVIKGKVYPQKSLDFN